MGVFSRRSLVFGGLAVLAGVGTAVSQSGERGWGEPGWDERRHRHRGRGRHGDHDCALRALAEGRAKPLSALLPDVEKSLGGQVIDVELEHCAGRVVYEIKVLRPDGRLVETVIDALTGERIADHQDDRDDR